MEALSSLMSRLMHSFSTTVTSKLFKIFFAQHLFRRLQSISLACLETFIPIFQKLSHYTIYRRTTAAAVPINDEKPLFQLVELCEPIQELREDNRMMWSL
jgi:hypothetical protein